MIGTILSIAFGWAKSGISALWKVLTAYPWQMAVIALLCLSFWLWRGWDGEVEAHARTKAEFSAFRTAIIDKTAEAMAKDKANAARVLSEQQQISKEREDALETRLSDTDRAYERLRTQASNGALGKPDVPALPDATCKAYGGTDCEGLLASLKAAEDQTSQLMELQAWVRSQAAIDVNGGQ